ncbi:hypothetical protein AY599_14305 [Leptolyngbya valderiana BDU 20041]|nr:Uma2 family endonuclease [Geitlerinema sp. CS-897]OAB62973.1 hypothetical protein AY599_14305 [Leptolyngbya valderiana BDU 20041]PPT06502.1 hypothetical protein CKA32_001686 [Geitlerinema sp. FC II]
MISDRSNFYVSPENYLDGERVSPIRHEYRQGEIFTMAGGTQAHGTIVLNLATLVRMHLRGSKCRAFSENMKVCIETVNAYYYPDLLVTCDERDRHPDRDFIQYPVLVLEVLSPSTEAFDRGAKFTDYRKLETLREYVLVSGDRPQVECYRRNNNGKWEFQAYETGDRVDFESLNLKIEISEIYEDI